VSEEEIARVDRDVEEAATSGETDSVVGDGLSRRQFVQGLGGVGLASAFGGFSIGTLSYYPVSGGFIQVDHSECAGCTSCMAACSLAHEGKVNLSLARIQIIKNDLAPFPGDITMHQCHQCEDAPCVTACPTGALSVDLDHGNVRRVDATKCVGCKTCIAACPFTPANLQFHPVTDPGIAPSSGTVHAKEHITQKCDLCTNTPFWSRTGGIGGNQACVAVCPAQAIKFVTDISAGYDTDFYATLPIVRGCGTVTA
jgi:protein NrfC